MRNSRTALIVAALVAATPLAACGGSDDKGGQAKVDGVSAAKVASGFKTATGAELVRDAGDPKLGFEVLDLPSSNDRYDQFGAFTVYVIRTEEGMRRLTTSPSGGAKLRFDERGIAFDRNPESTSYSAIQRIGDNVFIVWQAGERPEIDARFTRLSNATKAAVTGDMTKIPAAERSCEDQGITADAPKEGKCLDDGVQVTQVNGTTRLVTPVLAARVSEVREASTIDPTEDYRETERARGRFVIVTYRLENTGRAPIDLVDPKLIVDGKTYSESRDAYGALNDYSDMPAQPGESVVQHAGFDIPTAAAARAREHGVLVLPAAYTSSSTYLSAEESQGRIRLADVPVGEAPAPTPEPKEDKTPSLPSSGPKEAAVEKVVGEFFSAVRKRNIRVVCARLSKSELRKRGGVSGCRSGNYVNGKASKQVPKAGRKVTYMTVLTRNDTRAGVLATAKGYEAVIALSRESGRWRIRGIRVTK